jgi:hypothetical protein
LAYFFTGRFPEVESTIQRASARKLEMPRFLVLRYNIALLKGDKDQMEAVAGCCMNAEVDGVIISNATQLAGHVTIEERAILVDQKRFVRHGWRRFFSDSAGLFPDRRYPRPADAPIRRPAIAVPSANAPQVVSNSTVARVALPADRRIWAAFPA